MSSCVKEEAVSPSNFSASPPASKRWDLAVPEEIRALLASGAPVGVGVSGGKDSQAVALRVYEHLDNIGHTGPRLLIHSDLGRIEWRDSLPVCERLARRLDTELVVVRRGAGDLIDRFETRWENNLRRYLELSSVKLILPWATPGMRFCTSELKSQILSRALLAKFPGQQIVSVTGIRAQESPARAKTPVAAPQARLSRKGIVGWDWRPIHQWSTEDVFSYIGARGETLHAAYVTYGSSRVSCSFCIMSSLADMKASARCPANIEAYRLLVGLECRSTFAFQGSRWLGDIATELLTLEMRDELAVAKQRAQRRITAEQRLPRCLLFVAGWPQGPLSLEEARLLGDVRREVCEAIGVPSTFIDPKEIAGRYEELISLRGGGLFDSSKIESLEVVAT